MVIIVGGRDSTVVLSESNSHDNSTILIVEVMHWKYKVRLAQVKLWTHIFPDQ